MSLRYSFRHLFYGGKIHKERLYKVLQDLDSKESSGDSYDDTDIKADISALETRVKALEDAQEPSGEGTQEPSG